MAPALLLVAARAREGQVTRIVGAGQARGQIGGGAMTEPAARDDVFERRGAERFAVCGGGEVRAAVQAARVAQPMFGPRLGIGVERTANQLPEGP